MDPLMWLVYAKQITALINRSWLVLIGAFLPEAVLHLDGGCCHTCVPILRNKQVCENVSNECASSWPSAVRHVPTGRVTICQS